ncbi:MAG TPA: peptide deformylase [Clostridiales bacterium]|nr:peptide deformylase [Clostridiales bacterium]
MGRRTIRTDGDEILRKISKPVDRIDDKIRILAEDMIETMRHANGLGLAAPQVGILKRMFVAELDGQVLVMINPVIVKQQGEQEGREGCLSIPGMEGTVLRPARVVMEASDLQGDRHRYEAEGLKARVFCHELDHLNGILYKDKATNYERCEE